MENLLCNEIWAMSPNVQKNDCACVVATSFVWTTKEDCEEAIATFLSKETRYLPESSYFKLVARNDLIANARFKAVSWIIKSQRRMDLLSETIFAAVNYLDRFISLTQCPEWKCWMFELLSVACLSIATKFNETAAYPLHEFQEDLETWFDPNLIQRMEVTVLKALDWRVGSTTPFSYIHLLLTHHACNEQLTPRVTHLLLDALLDPTFLEFPHFVMAISAVTYVLQDLSASASDYANLETLLPQHHKDDFMRCMEKLVEGKNGKILRWGSGPSSPVTVLKADMFSCYEEFGAADVVMLTWCKKRKREEEGYLHHHNRNASVGWVNSSQGGWGVK